MGLDYRAVLKQSSIIEASAGTGKTYSMVELFYTLVKDHFLENPHKISSILFLTFTNKAIHELKIRLGNRIIDAYHNQEEPSLKEKWMKVLIEYPSLPIMTIQSFLQSVIPLLDPEVSLSMDSLDSIRLSENTLIIKKARELFLSLLQGSKPLGKWAEFSKEQVNFLLTMSEEAQNNSWDKFFSLPYKDQNPQNSKSLGDSFPLKKMIEGYQKIYTLEHIEPLIPDFSVPLMDLEAFLKCQEEFCKALEELQSSEVEEELQRVRGPSAGIRDILALFEKLRNTDSWQDKAFLFIEMKKEMEDTIKKSQNTKDKYTAVDFTLIENVLDILSQFSLQVLLYLVSYVGEDITLENPELYGFKGALNLANRLSFLEKQDPLTNLSSYSYVFIDECQDTNMLEWETLKLVFSLSSPKLFLVGDPKQLIYQFRSSDIHAFLKAKEEILAAGGKSYSLLESYRTPPLLLSNTNSIFSSPSYWGEEYPFISSKIDEHIPSSLDILNFDGENEKEDYFALLAKVFAKDIAYQKTQNKDESIAVLARKNEDLMIMGEELKKLHIPYLLHKEKDFFVSQEVYHFRILLCAMLPSFSYSDLILASHTPFFKVQRKGELALSPSFLEEINYYREILSEGLWNLFRKEILENSTLAEQTNLSEYTKYKQLFDDTISYLNPRNGSIKEALEYLEEMASVHSENNSSLSAISTPYKLVELLTIHSAKGLEFEDVYFLFPPKNYKEKNPFPPYIRKTLQDGEYKVKFEFSKNFIKEEKEKEIAAEKNLFYVALTRAKNRLILAYKTAHPHFFFQSLVEFLSKKPNGVNIRSILEEYEKGNIISITDTFIEKSSSLSKVFVKPKNPLWEMVSYTSLARNKSNTLSYLGEMGIEEDKRPLFLPKGRHTGIFLHSLLEELGNNKTEEQIEKYVAFMMKKYSLGDIPANEVGKIFSQSLSHSEKRSILYKYRKNLTLYTFLTQSEELLSRYHKEWLECSHEEGFLKREYTHILTHLLKAVLPEQIENLQTLLASHSQREWTLSFRVPPHPKTRYIESTIDFLFLGPKNKFYFLDWKTDSLPSYHPEVLKEWSLKEYDIQWKLYLVGVVRFLQTFWTSFEYEKHFGGFYYLYVRGIYNASQGVYFHKAPSLKEYNKILEEVGQWS